jgi:hypothetical protein
MDFEWLYVLFLTFFETSCELWPNFLERRLGEVRTIRVSYEGGLQRRGQGTSPEGKGPRYA